MFPEIDVQYNSEGCGPTSDQVPIQNNYRPMPNENENKIHRKQKSKPDS